MASAPRFSVRLVGSRSLAPLVRELSFAPTTGGPITFLAGQWVNLLLPVGADGDSGAPPPILRRSYSIASAPSPTAETFELAVTRVSAGPGSRYLHELPHGAELEAEGPQGFFTRDPHFSSPTLFVATGTGLTPLRSMLLAAIDAGSSTPVHLILGARHEADLLYRDELSALERSHPWFRATYTLSRAEDGWTGARGYVQTHVRGALAALASFGEPHVFACGLQRMVSAVRELVRADLGYPRARMHAERFD